MSPARMRLNKYLSRAGVASRREADGLLLQGRVRVNGETVRTLGVTVDPTRDRIEVDGHAVGVEPSRWILLNKPRGVVTTRRDEKGRKTVYALLDPADRSLSYVGRLDLGTEGLLLFTNDGDLLHALTHPSSEVPREYNALVSGTPSRRTLLRIESGVELDDGPARAEAVTVRKVLEGDRAVLSLVLREGRKHEVRRLLEAVGHPVHRLRRVAFGPIRLGDVEPGSWRVLGPTEIAALRGATE